MNKKTITPNPQRPVDRIPAGQLPSDLLALTEESLGEANVLSSYYQRDSSGLTTFRGCSFDGDDE